jgi:hypothetical protein
MRAAVLLRVIFAGFSAPAMADDEIAAAQSVRRSQIEAISRDDATTA